MNRAGKKHSIITIVICFLIAVIEGIDIQAAGIAAVGIREFFWFKQLSIRNFF